jgi:hypothetical protein
LPQPISCCVGFLADFSLRAAQSAGANVGTLIALVEQAMASLL